jgi:hypothetical protein
VQILERKRFAEGENFFGIVLAALEACIETNMFCAMVSRP